jgi:arylsulfatase A
MRLRALFTLLPAAIVSVAVLIASAASWAADRPNLLVIMCDDLGYGDLACYGHPVIKTPRLDQLAAEGIRLTDCYGASPICSSSRAGFMTGRTPTRSGILTWIDANNPMHLRNSEVTLAQLLRKGGYATCHVGKWHVTGHFNQKDYPQPDDLGYDHWFSTFNNAAPNHLNPINFVNDGKKVGPLEGYSCHIVVDEAVRWLQHDHRANDPFFLHLCFHESHEQVASPPELVDEYPQATKKGESLYYANVTNVDRAVGRMLDALDQLHLAEDTLVFFTSDHGPEILNIYPNAWRSHGSAQPFRGMKRYLTEGGIRVPGILRWKGHIAPGQTTAEPVCGIDILPTFCELAGVSLPTDRTFDGASIVPLLSGQPVERARPLFWHYYGGYEGWQVAVRDGEWKLLAKSNQSPEVPIDGSLVPGTVGGLKGTKLIEFQLFHITTDPTETNNLATSEPERLARLSDFAQRTYQAVIDECPDWFDDAGRLTETTPTP